MENLKNKQMINKDCRAHETLFNIKRGGWGLQLYVYG